MPTQENPEATLVAGRRQASQRIPSSGGKIPGGEDNRIRIGGQASVFKVLRRKDGQAFAVKTILDSGDGYFDREDRTLATLGYSNTDRLPDRKQVRDLVLELCDYNLYERISLKGVLGEHEAAKIIAPLAKTLGQVHEEGFIHCDVKPENVLLADRESNHDCCVPKLCDFGLACCMTNPWRVSGIGTWVYMAPEAMLGDGCYTPAVDVWGLGMVLYHCLTARTPFLKLRREETRRISESVISSGSGVHHGVFCWDGISDGARDLIRGMTANRLVIKEILNHEWIKRHSSK
ncbi:hypothetical protein SELMODRAFT_110675 [Selaginella moellendorffii]|uniref:Protein kinase domain-containing protein n=1 Tax=Selaginella moellendorffii TaxID=88036 RepID=D8S7A5_SELML|nr:probable serine/threonine-protein kinase pXi [Selaginella moellendorffii]EFJ19724.1 hypothetical protein SELMODRAFT_110675 [Selaginella moellendorffii]|eukprot:XP_002979316.1 probable serine/threonine-protein kinase pXi [Selaginella moellendorffii]